MMDTTPGPRHTRSRPGAALLAVVLTGVLSACGNLTAGGFGEARVVANGDAPETAIQTAEVMAGPARTDHEAGEDDIDPVGEIELDFRLYLESNDRAPFELSDRELQVELELDGSVEADVITARVPANSYSGLRIAFSEIEIQVQDGVVIDGRPITGRVDIEFEDLEIVLPLNLTVLEGSVVEILLDLNAATWLAFVDPDTQTVNPEDFADAVTVRLR